MADKKSKYIEITEHEFKTMLCAVHTVESMAGAECEEFETESKNAVKSVQAVIKRNKLLANGSRA